MNVSLHALALSVGLALNSLSSAAADSSANLVQNGSFENVVWIPFGTPPWVFVDVPAGFNSWPNAPDGGNYLALGTIYQDVPTTANQRYLLSFAAAADLLVQPSATIEVQWDGQSAAIMATQPHEYDPTRNRNLQMVWERFSVLVTARDANSRLVFTSPNESAYRLDDVRLVPMPNNPPIPVVRVVNEVSVPPLLYDPHGYSHFVIAPDGISTTVILDGSGSTDPDGDPLSYLWGYFDEGTLHALSCLPGNSPATVICTFYVGDYDRERLGLAVCDGRGLCATLRFGLYVVTPADVTRFLMESMGVLEEDEGVRFRSKNAVLNALTRAGESFDRGKVSRGIHYLEQFQQFIRAQQRSLGDQLTGAFLELSQKVIDAVNSQCDCPDGTAEVARTPAP